MKDTIDALTVGIIFSAVLILWIGFDLGRRRAMQREATHLARDLRDYWTRFAITFAGAAVAMAAAGECAHAWHDHAGSHLCVRPYDHDQRTPHLCGICEGGIERSKS